MKRLFLAYLLLISGLIFACGGGDGGGGVVSGSDTPSISGLYYNPSSALINDGNGRVQISGWFYFADAGGDIQTMSLVVLDGLGNQIDSLTDPLEGAAGITQQYIYWGFNADTSAGGNFTIQFYITDAGGRQSNILSFVFRIFVDPPWRTKADMPTGRQALAAASADGKVYAIGGSLGGVALEIYEPSINTWTAKAAMPTARFGLAAAEVNGKVYALGGLSPMANPLHTMEEYDPGTDTWATKAPMPTERWGLGACAINGKIYAVGGNRSGSVATLEVYDPGTDTWTAKAPMPTPRERIAVGTINGKLYVVGGLNFASYTVLNTVEEYDPISDSWTTVAPMLTARMHLAAGVVNNKLYAIGGSGPGPISEYRLHTVEEYDPSTNTWKAKASMPTARADLAAAVANGKLYAIGGFEAITKLEEYDPAKDP